MALLRAKLFEMELERQKRCAGSWGIVDNVPRLSVRVLWDGRCQAA